MTKEEVFLVLDEHRKAEYEDHAVLVPVLDYMKEHDECAYDSFRRLLTRVHAHVGTEIASELINKRQLRLDL